MSERVGGEGKEKGSGQRRKKSKLVGVAVVVPKREGPGILSLSLVQTDERPTVRPVMLRKLTRGISSGK